MGVDIGGGMIVGELRANITLPEVEGLEDYELAEHYNMSELSPYYDSDPNHRYVGFKVYDVAVKDIDVWLEDVKKKAAEFEKITGSSAKLIGAQDVW